MISVDGFFSYKFIQLRFELLSVYSIRSIQYQGVPQLEYPAGEEAQLFSVGAFSFCV